MKQVTDFLHKKSEQVKLVPTWQGQSDARQYTILFLLSKNSLTNLTEWSKAHDAKNDNAINLF